MSSLASAAFFLVGVFVAAPGLAQSISNYLTTPEADGSVWEVEAPGLNQHVPITLVIRTRFRFAENGRNINTIVVGAERTGSDGTFSVDIRDNAVSYSGPVVTAALPVPGTDAACRYSADDGPFSAMPATLMINDTANNRQRFTVLCDLPANPGEWGRIDAMTGGRIGARFEPVISRRANPNRDVRSHVTVTYADGRAVIVNRNTAHNVDGEIPTSEIHIHPRHGDTSASIALGDLDRLHRRADGPIIVTVRSSVTHQERGRNTHAISLGLTTENASVTVAGEGGRLAADISRRCHAGIPFDGRYDNIETLSCDDIVTSFPIEDLPDGVYTVGIPAGGTGEGEGRYRILVNEVPYRPAADQGPWIPLPQVSAVVTVVTDTRPVVTESGVTFFRNVPVDWVPAVSGGNGEVRISLDDPGIPGLTLGPGGRLTGIPERSGRHTVTVTATDSDSSEFADPDDETTAEVTIDVVIQGDPVFAEAGLTHVLALGAPVDWAPPAATGDGPLRYHYADPRIPGLSLDPESGRLSGVPSRAGDYIYRVAVTDSDSAQDPLQADDETVAEFLVRVVAAAGPTVSLAPGPRAGVEGGPLAVGFAVAPAPQVTLTVPYTLGEDADPGTADAGASDYSDTGAGSVLVAPGETRGTIRVGLSSDTAADGGEVFTVGLGVPTAQGGAAPALGSPAAATVTVLEPLSLLLGNVRLAEGADPVPLTFTADLGSTVASDLPVTLALDPASTAVPGTDFAMRLPSLTVASGTSVGTAVAAIDVFADGVKEQTEQIVFVAEAEGRGRGRDSMLVDDGDPPRGTVRIDYSGHASPLREGEEARFAIALTGSVRAEVAVPWELAPDSSARASDVAVASGTVTFPGPNFADGGVRSIRVPITDDTLAERGEVLRLRLGDPTTPSDPGQAAGLLVARREADVMIAESDRVTVSVSGPDLVDEGGTAAHTATFGGGERPGPVDLVVSVSAGGTGPDPVRVLPLVRQVTFPVGAAEDPDNADGEVTVGIGGRFSASALPYPVEFVPGSVTMRVRDNDATAGVSFDSGSYRVVEGGPDTTVTVRLDRDSGRTLSIPVTLGDPGTPLGPLVFAPGETEQTLALSSPADTVAESPVTLRLRFGALPAGAAAGATLTEADVVYTGRDIALSAAPATLTEGVGSQVVTVSAELGGPVRASDLPVTLWVGAPGSTAELPDYAVDANLAVTISANTRTGTATFAVRDDDAVEPDERIVVFGSTAQRDAVAPTTVTVADADTAGLGIARSPGSPAPAEGGEATYDVSLGPVHAEVVVPWEVTPLPGGIGLDEVEPTAGTLTFAAGPLAGRSPQTISVRFPDDNLGEPAEDVVIRLGTPSAPSHPGLAARISVTTDRLAETLPASDPVALAVSGPSVLVEGERGVYRVHATGALGSRDIGFRWGLIDGEAVVGADYGRILGNLAPGGSPLFASVPVRMRTLPAGATEEAVTIRTVDDNVGESAETFSVRFDPAPDADLSVGFQPESPLVLTVTILDDDLTLGFDAPRHELGESGGWVTVTARLSAPAGVPVSVPVVVTPVDGAVPGDLSVSGASVVFGPGDTAATLEVRASDDRFDEPEEGFELSFDLSSLPWLTAGARSTTAVRIIDNDGVSPNSDPMLSAPGPLTFSVAEDALPGTPVGEPIGADDANGDLLLWSLTGTDAALFDILGSGQLTLASGAALDHERSPRLVLAVQVRDNLDADSAPDTLVDASVPVTVEVTDVTEPPGAPPPPAVSTGLGMAGVVLSLGWTAPASDAGAVTGYDVEYREAPMGGPGNPGWVTVPHSGAGVSATVPGLPVGATYEARVRARNADGPGAWSGATRGGIASGALSLRIVPRSPAALEVAEGGGEHILALGVALSGAQFLATDLPLSVAAAGRTATEGADFAIALPGGVSLTAGDLSVPVDLTVTPVDDPTAEADETLVAHLSAGDFASAPLSVTITDDDTAALSFGPDVGTLKEGDTPVFTVTLSRPVDTEVRATLSVGVDSHAASAGDTVIPAATVTFAAHAGAGATREVTVSVVNDQLSEPAEPLSVWITGQGPAFRDRVTVAAAGATVRAGIAESDPMTLEWEVLPPSIAEGDFLTFTPVIRGGVNPARVDMVIRLGGSATPAEDYRLPEGFAVLPGDPAGVARASIPARATWLPQSLWSIVDSESEPDETIEFAVTGIHTEHGLIAPRVAGATVTATILGDRGRVVLSPSAPLVAEGSGAAPLTITASIAGGGAAPEDLEFPLAVRQAGSATRGDYEFREIGGAGAVLQELPTVTITAGSSLGSAAFMFEPVDDTRVEADETLLLRSRRLVYDVRPATVVIEDNDTATLSVLPPAAAVDESSGAAEVAVRLDARVDADIAYRLSVSAGSAVGGDDYREDLGGRHVIPANARQGTAVRVPVVNDRLAEGEETFTVFVADVASALQDRISVAEATVTIAPSDPLRVRLTGPERVAEGAGFADYTVAARRGESTREVTVGVRATGESTAAEGADRGALGTPLRIPAGVETVTLRVPLVDDTVREEDKTLVVELFDPSGGGGGPGGISLGDAFRVTTALVDDDHPEVSVSFAASEVLTVAEGEGLDVTVRLDAAPGRVVEVPVVVRRERGALDSDFGGFPATVTFGAGSREGTLRVTATDDSDDDDGERIRLQFGILPGQVVAAAPDTLSIDIRDNDGRGPTVELSWDLSRVDEASGAQATTVTVGLANVLDDDLAVPLAFGAGSADGADHDASVRLPTVTVEAGSLSETAPLTLSLVDDRVVEADETIVLSASVAGFDTVAETVTVIDNDQADLRITGPRRVVRESTGSVLFTLSLSRQVDADVSVSVTTADHSARAGSDYEALAAWRVFERGSRAGSRRTISVRLFDDAVSESLELLTMSIARVRSDLSRSIRTPIPIHARAGIGASDRLVLSLSGPGAVREDSPHARFTVRAIEGRITTPATVWFRVSPSSDAVEGVDRGPVPSSVTLAAGATSVTFDVAIIDDTVHEPNESLIISMTAAAGGSPEGASVDRFGTVTHVTIRDDERSLRVTAPSTGLRVAEGGTASLSVSVSAPPRQALTVRYSIGGEAASADLSDPSNGTLTVGVGETSGTVLFPVADDDIPELAERFTVSLTSVGFASESDDLVRLWGPTAVTATIAASDALALSLSGTDNAEVVEGGAIGYQVLALGAPADTDAAVTVRVASRTASAGIDYSAPAVVTVRPGVPSTPFSVQANRDGSADSGEPFTVSIGPAAAGAHPVLVHPAALTATIVEANAQPTFDTPTGNTVLSFTVSESARTGDPVGTPIVPADADGDTLGYSLSEALDLDEEGTALSATASRARFGIDGAGQLTVGDFTGVDHELGVRGLSVTVSVSDRKGPMREADPSVDAVARVHVSVVDELEPPPAPPRPTVSMAPAGGHRALSVWWDPSDMPGVPRVRGYEVEHKRSGAPDSAYGAAGVVQVGREPRATIFGLEPDARHDVRVRARNEDGTGEWSMPGSGVTREGHVVSLPGSAVTALEGSVATVSVTVTPPSPHRLSVRYSVRARGATAGADFTDPGAGLLVIRPNAAGGLLEFPVVDDTDAEFGESFVVSLDRVRQAGTLDSHAFIGSPPGVTVAIAPSDAVVLSVGGPARQDVAEGESSAHTLFVTGGNSTSALTVALSLGGDATPGADFAAPESVTVAAGASSARFTVSAMRDSARDAGETVLVAVGDVSALSGVLADPSVVTATIVEPNAPPSFGLAPGVAPPRAVRENSPTGSAVGRPVAAADADGDTLSYSLSTPGHPGVAEPPGLFGLGLGGQITVADGARLDHETRALHTVVVGVGDGRDARGLDDNATDARVTVRVSVTDRAELPAAPSGVVVGPAPAGGHRSLAARWTAPDTTGIPPVTAHVIEHRARGAPAGDAHTLSVGAGTSATIAGLGPDSAHEVRVRAVNDEGPGAWSLPAAGRTDPATVVSALAQTLGATEGMTVSVSVGVIPAPTVALTGAYSLRAAGATPGADFTDPGSGMFTIAARASVGVIPLGIEDDSVTGEPPEVFVVSLSSVSDGTADSRAALGDDAETSVTIAADGAIGLSLSTDGDPTRQGETAMLTASLSSAPSAEVRATLALGGDAVTGDDYTPPPAVLAIAAGATVVTADIAVLPAAVPGRVIRISVDSVTATDAVVAATSVVSVTITAPNAQPAFARTRATVTVREDATPGDGVGSAIAALDDDGDPLTYSLAATDPALFGVVADSGLVTVAVDATLDHETLATHTVTLRVRDGKDAIGAADTADDADITVAVVVTDVAEPPMAPGSLTVVAAGGHRALSVDWEAPNDSGRPGTDGYDVEYRRTGAGEFGTASHTGAGTEATIGGLLPDTAHEVRVRARNRDGPGPWATAEGDTGAGFVVSMADAALSVAEDDGSADVRVVVRPAAPMGGIIVTYAVAERGALNGIDYRAPTTLTVTVPAGETAATIGVPIVDDGVRELAEAFAVALREVVEPGGRAVLGDDTETWVTIGANDAAVVDLSAPPTVSVGATADAVVALSGEIPESEVVATLSTRGTAQAGTDYTPFAGSVTVTPPATSVIVAIAADADATPGREIGLEISGLDPMFLPGAATATVTIVSANDPPVFVPASSPVPFRVPEDAASGETVGNPIRVVDSNADDTLAHRLSGGDGLFGVSVTSPGVYQIVHDPGPGLALDFETAAVHTVTLGVGDGKSAIGAADSTHDISMSVAITVLDTAEPPSAPGRLSAGPPPASGDRALTVGWDAPGGAGIPPVNGYDIERKPAAADDSAFTADRVSHAGADTVATISGLDPGTEYAVRVRARNDEGAGDWAETEAATGQAGNVPPAFAPGAAAAARLAVGELAPPGTAVGEPVAAIDGDLDPLAFSLSDGSGNFGIEGTTRGGRITVAAGATLDYESAILHTVTVSVSDGKNAAGETDDSVDASLAVVVTVTDAPEPPLAPTGLALLAPIGARDTGLEVRWTPPDNAGRPLITGHDVQHKRAGEDDSAFTAAGVSLSGMDSAATITGLAAEAPHDVRVRARNGEGDGEWAYARGTTGAVDDADSGQVVIDLNDSSGNPVTVIEPGISLVATATIALSLRSPVAEETEVVVTVFLVDNEAAVVGTVTILLDTGEHEGFAIDTTTVRARDNDAVNGPVDVLVGGRVRGGPPGIVLVPDHFTVRDLIQRDIDEGNPLADNPTASDIDTATISISGPGADVDEASSKALFTVTLSAPLRGTVTVSLATSDNGATAGEDYTAPSPGASVVFADEPGTDSTRTFEVDVSDDDLSEGAEEFALRVVSVTPDFDGRIVVPADTEATATIGASDPVTVALEGGPAFARETDAATYRVTLTGGESAAPVTVTLAVGSDTADGDDYTAPPPLEIPAGDTAGTVDIPILANTDPGPETITVSVSAATGGGGGGVSVHPTDNSAETTIGEPATLGFVTANLSVAELDTESVVVSVTSDVAVSETITVSRVDEGSTAATTDYTVAPPSLELAFADTPAAVATLVVTPVDDIRDEGSEEEVVFTIRDGDLPGGISLGTTASVTVTITDNDEAATEVALGLATVSLGENAGSVGFSVTASLGGTVPLGADLPVLLAIGASSDAIRDADYTVTLPALTISAGHQSASGDIGISVTDDTILEGAETVVVTGTAGDRVIVPVELEIGDNDTAQVSLGGPAGGTVAEGAGSVVFTATLAGTADAEVTVTLGTEDGTAVGGEDFVARTAVTDTVTFAAGISDGTAEFAVDLADDTLFEAEEVFSVTVATDGIDPDYGGALTPAGPASVAIVPDAADRGTVVIQGPTMVHGSGAAAVTQTEVAEGQDATLTLSLTGGAGAENVTVPVGIDTSASGHTAQPEDYTAPSTPVVITAGETVATFTMAVASDGTADAGEIVVVSIGVPTGLDAARGPPASAGVTIIEPNAAPMFATTSLTREVAEGAAADSNVGAVVTATDPDAGDTPTYRLVDDPAMTDEDSDRFGIDGTTGQITVAAETVLDFETKDTYTVTVEALDGRDARGIGDIAADATANVTITVLDANEAPGNPTALGGAALPVAQGGHTRLSVSWVAPVEPVGSTPPPVIGYDLQYREVGTSAYTDFAHAGTGVEATIAGLTPDTPYDLRVRAVNEESESAWVANTAEARTEMNAAPGFADATATLAVVENTAAGTAIGDPITAAANDLDDLTYALTGPGFDLFGVDNNGQVSVVGALDFETAESYALILTAEDPFMGTDTLELVIKVTDDDTEAPGVPGSLTVMPPSAEEGGHTRLSLSWAASTNTGPALTYEIRYSVGDADAFLGEGDAGHSVTHDGTSTTATITGLQPDTEYDVEVVASNDEGRSDAAEASGTTGSNIAPTFATTTVTLTVAENAAIDAMVGDPVTAAANDLDDLIYELGGTDATLFDVGNDGQVSVAGALDFEAAAAHTLGLTATDPFGGSATLELVVEVTDDDTEAPGVPGSLTVMPLSAAQGGHTRLSLSWAVPTNTGPALTYEIRYSVGDTDAFLGEGDTGYSVTHDGTSTTATITGLQPDTEYDVEVVASNAEGRSDAAEASGTTGSNVAPTFATSPVMLMVVENAVPGTAIGNPVTAVANDLDDLTYGLGGTGSTLFGVGNDGQVSVAGALDFETAEVHILTLTATDPFGGSATLELVVEVTDDDTEAPGVPGSLTVMPLPPAQGGHTRLSLSWAASTNTGPALTYEIRYSVGDTDAFLGEGDAGYSVTHDGVSTTATITGLQPDTEYDVEVVASNGEGRSDAAEASGTTGSNVAPTFAMATVMLTVTESAAIGVAVGVPVTAAANDLDDLTYGLGGTDSTLFDVGNDGQVSVAGALDFETAEVHTLTLTATDPFGGSATLELVVEVTDDDTEVPGVPGSLTVTPLAAAQGGHTRLSLSWAVPANTGPALTYEIRYSVGDADAFLGAGDAGYSVTHDGVSTTATITGLRPDTEYDVEVVASNAEGASDAAEASGTTGSNVAPTFAMATVMLTVTESAAIDTTIGVPVTAAANDLDDLAYGLGGTDSTLFDVGNDGQVSVAGALDFETAEVHILTLTATDPFGGSATLELVVEVTDDDTEVPGVPGSLTVTPLAAAEGGHTRLSLSWAASTNTGPALTYEIRYSVGDADAFLGAGDAGHSVTHDGTSTTAMITGLRPDTEYDVEVVASNGEGRSDAAEASGTTGSNVAPTFATATVMLTVTESAAIGVAIGDPVTATANDLDDLAYGLGGTDSTLFGVDNNGQVSVAGTLDFETAEVHTLTLTATDPFGGSAILVLVIEVTDDDTEAPGAPGLMTVTVSAGRGNSLSVTWTTPENAGPVLLRYEVAHKRAADDDTGWSDPLTVAATETSVTIEGLDDRTEYDVRVWAVNAEGEGPWAETDTAVETGIGVNLRLLPRVAGPGDADVPLNGDDALLIFYFTQFNRLLARPSNIGLSRIIVRGLIRGRPPPDTETDEIIAAAVALGAPGGIPGSHPANLYAADPFNNDDALLLFYSIQFGSLLARPALADLMEIVVNGVLPRGHGLDRDEMRALIQAGMALANTL